MLLYGIRWLLLAGLTLIVVAAVLFDAPGAVLVAGSLFWVLEHIIRGVAGLVRLLAHALT